MGIGVLAAIAASLCCITPVLALIAGISGIASSFTWLEPARPYFIGVTGLVLGFAWYQKLRPKPDDIDCECDEDGVPIKSSFWQSRSFLGIVTVFAALMLAFPYYTDAFFPETESTAVVASEANIIFAEFEIEGMTCTGCEHGVNFALKEQAGVIAAQASYENGTATVEFDKSKVDVKTLADAVTKQTGYSVISHKLFSPEI